MVLNWNSYIGIPYSTYNCADLVIAVYKDVGIHITSIEDLTDLKKMFKPVQNPKELDMVVLRNSKRVPHVGIWCDEDHKGVVHSIKNRGVCFDTLKYLIATGWKEFFYYRHESLYQQ